MTTSLHNKVCLITGANRGIGKAAAMELASRGAQILMVCRNAELGAKAKEEIIDLSGNKKVELFICDLSSFSSINAMVQDLKSKFSQLDILINNAVIFVTKREMTEDKIELQFAVNYLAGFLLTNLLMKELKAAESARIINVSSQNYYFGWINFSDLNYTKYYDGLMAYNQSKLGNMLFTYELARRLQDSNITVNCLHPGGVSTDIADKYAKGIYRFFWKVSKPFLISPTKGARTIIYLAASEDVKNITGKYFRNCKVVTSSRRSRKKEIAQKLWDVSLALTKDVYSN